MQQLNPFRADIHCLIFLHSTLALIQLIDKSAPQVLAAHQAEHMKSHDLKLLSRQQDLLVQHQ
jgi:hypothetical protein